MAAGQLDGEVGAQPARVGERRRLLVEVAVLEHPGELDHALQLHFAPASAHARRAQRADQVLGLEPQLLLRQPDLFEQRLQLRRVGGVVPIAVLQRRPELRQRVLDGRDQRVERLLALAEIGRRFLVDVADLLIGQLQELVGARAKRFTGKRLKRIAKLLLLAAPGPGREKPPGGKPGDQRDDNSDSGDQFHWPLL